MFLSWSRRRSGVDRYDLAEVLVMDPTVSRDYAAWVRVGRGLLYVGPGRNTLIEPAEEAEVAERARLAEALRRPGPEPSTLDATEAAIAKAEEVTVQVERRASILKMLARDRTPRRLRRRSIVCSPP